LSPTVLVVEVLGTTYDVGQPSQSESLVTTRAPVPASIALAAVAAVLLLVSGCGAGVDTLDDEDSFVGDPDCFALPELYAEEDIVVTLGVRYAADPGPHLADIYRPPGDGPFPALIQVHGGGFVSGSRTGFEAASRYYATRGIASVAIDYTLAESDGSTHAYPVALQDVLCAVRGLRARADELSVDPDRVAFRGGSAGATLVNMIALAGEAPLFDGGCNDNGLPIGVLGVIDYYGGADFLSPISADGNDGTALFGEDPDMELVAQVSPLANVSSDDPPYVIGHGTADQTVVIEQSRSLRDALEAVGVDVELVEVPGAVHGFIQDFGGAETRSVRCREEALLNRVLGP